jgi:hypothetical protein
VDLVAAGLAGPPERNKITAPARASADLVARELPGPPERNKIA